MRLRFGRRGRGRLRFLRLLLRQQRERAYRLFYVAQRLGVFHQRPYEAVKSVHRLGHFRGEFRGDGRLVLFSELFERALVPPFVSVEAAAHFRLWRECVVPEIFAYSAQQVHAVEKSTRAVDVRERDRRVGRDGDVLRLMREYGGPVVGDVLP